MALDTTQLKTDLADDLREIQSYDTVAGGYLERKVVGAASWLVKDKDWNFVLGQTTISAIDGSLGPYSLPSDFEGKPVERRLTKYYASDTFDVDALVKDGPYNRRYEVYINRSTGTPVLMFATNPGTATLYLTYRKKVTVIADLAAWPSDDDLKRCIMAYASFLAVFNTPELQAMAANYKSQAEEWKAALWLAVRRGSTRPDNRTPQDVFGQPLYQSFAGETL